MAVHPANDRRVRTMARVAMTTRTAGAEPLGRTADGRPLPARARRALAGACVPPDRYNGWLDHGRDHAAGVPAPRLELGRPRAILFDETYYAKDAYALLTHG